MGATWLGPMSSLQWGPPRPVPHRGPVRLTCPRQGAGTPALETRMRTSASRMLAAPRKRPLRDLCRLQGGGSAAPDPGHFLGVAMTPHVWEKRRECHVVPTQEPL